MADTALTLVLWDGGGGVAADDDGSAYWPYVKAAFGASGTQTHVTASAGLPVTPDSGGFAVSATLDAETTKVIGTVNLGAVDNAVLDAIAASVGGTLNVDGSGVTQPISGTVTANLSATDNAVLDTIDAVLDAINAKLVTGTVIGDVNLGATDNAVLDSIASALAGTLTVDLGGNNDVVASGVAAENAAVSGNPVLIGGRYDSSARTLGDGDVGAAALNASGHVLVEISAGAGSGGTSAADDADFVAGTTSGTLAMGVYESSPSSVTDGDMGALGITANRELKVSAAAGSAEVVLGTATYTETTSAGVTIAGVRNDTLAALADTDNEFAPFQMDALGAVWAHIQGMTTPNGDSMIDDTNDAVQVNVVAGSTAGTEYTEDAVFSAAVGGAHLMVREDAPSSIAADNDWIAQRATAYGAGYVQVVDSSGNFIDTFGGSGGTAAADDADFVAGTTSGTLIQGIYESSPTSVTDGDMGAVGIDVNRQMKVVEASAAGILADTASMDTNLGTVAGAVSGGQMQVDIVADGADLLTNTNFAAAFGTAGSADAQVISVQGIASMTPILVDGSGVTQPVSGTVTANAGSGTQAVSLASVPSHAVTNAGTFAVQLTGSGLTALQLIDNAISGAGFNITQLGGAAIPMTTTQADNLANTLDSLNVSSFGYLFDGTAWDRARGDSTNGALVNLGANNDVTVTSGAITETNSTAILADTAAIDTATAAINAKMVAGTTIGRVEHTTTDLADGVKTVSSAGTDEALAGSTSAKWVIIQAQTDNTGVVAVGNTGVDATVATGTGVALAAGESITLPCDNLADIFVDATVSGEGVRFTYGT